MSANQRTQTIAIDLIDGNTIYRDDRSLDQFLSEYHGAAQNGTLVVIEPGYLISPTAIVKVTVLAD